MIDKFDGEYRFLSNFYSCLIKYDKWTYINSEAAFQAQKCVNENDKEKFPYLNPSEAKRLGRKVKMRSDWDQIKDSIMEEIVRNKFTQNDKLKDLLLNTGNEELVEGNTWNDTYWGVCNGVGQNKLGKILMDIRNELSR